MKQYVTNLEQKYKSTFPTLYCLLSSFFFALTALTIKLLPQIPATQILYIRSLITLIALKFISDKSMDSYPQNQIIKLQWRGIVGGIGTVAWFIAVKMIPSSEVIVLSKISPLWTALIAAYILQTEQLTKKIIVTIIFCIIGIAFIARPPFLTILFFNEQIIDQIDYQSHLIGISLALLSSITQSIVQVIISLLSKSVHQLTILQYFSFYTILLPMIFSLYTTQFVSPEFNEWIILLLNSLSGGLAQYFMNRSFILGKLNQMSMLGQSQVIFSYIFDIFILGQTINLFSIIGSILVCGCLMIVII